MIKISENDLLELKTILGNLYLKNGNIKEVLLLSQAIDEIILSVQSNIDKYNNLL